MINVALAWRKSCQHCLLHFCHYQGLYFEYTSFAICCSKNILYWKLNEIGLIIHSTFIYRPISLRFLSADYHYVMRIPEQARSISIAEFKRSPSYLALRSTNGIYFLNGNWRVSWPGSKTFAGCAFEYQRPFDRPEKITSAGPLNQPLIVEVWTLSSPVPYSWYHIV